MGKKIDVVLMTDVEGLGSQYSIVQVKAGYARNYLIPQGLAVYATQSARKHYSDLFKQKKEKELRERQKYLKIKEALDGAVIKVPVKASPKGKIFGSVSNIQVADILQSKGYDIPRQNITILEGETIKEVGEYHARVKIWKDIEAQIKIQVVVE